MPQVPEISHSSHGTNPIQDLEDVYMENFEEGDPAWFSALAHLECKSSLAHGPGCRHGWMMDGLFEVCNIKIPMGISRNTGGTSIFFPKHTHELNGLPTPAFSWPNCGLKFFSGQFEHICAGF